MPAKKGRPVLSTEQKKRNKVEKLVGHKLTDEEWEKIRVENKPANIISKTEQDTVNEMLQKMAHAQASAAANLLPKEAAAGEPSKAEPGENDPDYEQKKIAEIQAKMQFARDSLMSTLQPRKVTVTEEGDHEVESFVVPNREPTIEDEPHDNKPKFVQDDELGWEEMP